MLVGVPRQLKRIIRGEIQNISARGLCLLTDQPLKESDVIRGEVLLPQGLIGIATLMHVRWKQQSTKVPCYKVGLQFLL